MEPASESSQNVEIFKIKKLIKSLEAARGCCSARGALTA